MGGRGSSGNRGISSTQEQIDAIHQYQQVSWEGISDKEKRTLSQYIDTQVDVEEQVSRGMVVSQSTIDKWLKQGSVSFEGMTSWSTDGSIAARFSEVSRAVDAEDGKRSVIIVSEKGLTNSAALPRTNAYTESEVLTSTRDYEIVSSRVQQSIGSNKSPTTTIIFVRPRRKR